MRLLLLRLVLYNIYDIGCCDGLSTWENQAGDVLKSHMLWLSTVLCFMHAT